MMLKGLFHNLPNIVTVLIFKPSPVNNCFIVNVHAVRYGILEFNVPLDTV